MYRANRSSTFRTFVISALAASGNVIAQVDGPISSSQLSEAQDQDIKDYWTPDKMNNATPMPSPMQTIIYFNNQSSNTELFKAGDPILIPGSPPAEKYFINEAPPEANLKDTEAAAQMPQAMVSPQSIGLGPSHPLDYANYGKFQRWTMQGKYVIWPRSIHGKIFFTSGGENYVCSGTVAGRSTIITAAHCMSDGAGSLSTNILFCPGYNQAGENAQFGCWSGVAIAVSAPFHNSGDPDHDYACFVTATTGSVQPEKIGIITGWSGRAYNFPANQPVITFGYPAAPPFPGNTIQQTASVEWYEIDFTPGGPKSKYIGSDLKQGSSGGGWFLSWRAPTAEVMDTDNSTITDPIIADSGPYINGVNSHSRCFNSCDTPPTASAGLYWQEMGSPAFWSSASDSNDSADVFAVCDGHPNNNP